MFVFFGVDRACGVCYSPRRGEGEGVLEKGELKGGERFEARFELLVGRYYGFLAVVVD